MSTILLVLALPLIIVFTWFALEFALVARHASSAKSAADAIATAAAARYPDGADVARTDAISAAGANNGPNGPLVLLATEGPGGGGDLEFGTWDPQTHVFTPDATEGGPAVRATVRLSSSHPNGAVSLLLAGLFNVPPVEMEHASIAVYHPPTHTTSLLLADADDSSLALAGTSILRSRGGVSVAADDAGAAPATGSAKAPIAPRSRANARRKSDGDRGRSRGGRSDAPKGGRPWGELGHRSGGECALAAVQRRGGFWEKTARLCVGYSEGRKERRRGVGSDQS
jgi:hypothetical protein